ncbi:MAG TPA: helix-turn-helix transcriptional regulator [Kofleriaceae bacterium]|nr:helix-turn-helix transcriptional regulator [Kofleriaceae bacterium]
MMITGRLWKAGTWWLAESQIADVCTQARSRKDAARMLADAFETLIDRPSCKVTVADPGGADGEVTIEASEPAALAAFVLQRLRQSSGKSLSEVAQAMGRTSKNAYARYEQGRAVPTIEMFDDLLRAVSRDTTLIIGSRRLGTRRAAAPAKRKRRRAA